MEDGSDIKIFAGYGAYLYKVNDQGVKGFPKEIIGKRGVNHSYNIGIGGTKHFGYSFLNFTAFFGQNLHLTNSHVIGSEFIYVNNKFGKDNDYNLKNIGFETYTAGGALGFGHTFGEKYTLQAGIGYVANFGPGYIQQDDRLSAYLNTIIKVNDWYSIIPEISYFDELIGPSGDGKSYQKQGSLISVGFVNVLEF